MNILEKYKAGELMLDEFLAAGYLLEGGDKYLGASNSPYVIGQHINASLVNKPGIGDHDLTVIKSTQLDKLIKEQEMQKQKVKQPTPHPHKELIERYISDIDKWAVIFNVSFGWGVASNPGWLKSAEYKVVLKEYAELACKYFNGECEAECNDMGIWLHVDELHFDNDKLEYREKPKPNPKDGEVWVVEGSKGNWVGFFAGDRFYFSGGFCGAYVSLCDVKPLYKMVKADG